MLKLLSVVQEFNSFNVFINRDSHLKLLDVLMSVAIFKKYIYIYITLSIFLLEVVKCVDESGKMSLSTQLFLKPCP